MLMDKPTLFYQVGKISQIAEIEMKTKGTEE